MKKARIAVIGLKGLPAYGGAAAVGENIINQLESEFDFTVLSVASHANSKNTNLGGTRQIIFKNHGKGGLNTFIYYIKCLFHVLTHKYDLVHLHHAESGFITPFLRLRYKVLVTFHGIYDNFVDPKFSSFQNKFFKFSQKLNLRFSNVVVSVSQPDTEYLTNKYSREIFNIPNGINLDKKMDLILANKKTDDYIFFAAGRIYQIKGLHILFSAAKKIKLNCEIKVAGDIDQVPKYKRDLEILSEDLDVDYLGLIKDKHRLMEVISKAEVFIFPSTQEAMSMMLLEVVSMKTPVIASDIPSNRAIFTETEMLFFKNNDSDSLAKQLKFAMSNPEKMKEKAERAFQKLILNNTWSFISKRYAKVYESLL
jgi:glycosyltransferase involved in cell wall biosynthesis